MARLLVHLAAAAAVACLLVQMVSGHVDPEATLDAVRIQEIFVASLISVTFCTKCGMEGFQMVSFRQISSQPAIGIVVCLAETE